ncbi:hypothetical protein E3N88_23397 [Mikania micrantha]|uniref:Uncharacterized protein n=1 Tax=Mikania micrantha TaxID=192012 RepID=A0A5N6ND59_9ASTR|nr:hypothetical protein E3N88_23397 [Mikania micrantha]
MVPPSPPSSLETHLRCVSSVRNAKEGRKREGAGHHFLRPVTRVSDSHHQALAPSISTLAPLLAQPHKIKFTRTTCGCVLGRETRGSSRPPSPVQLLFARLKKVAATSSSNPDLQGNGKKPPLTLLVSKSRSKLFCLAPCLFHQIYSSI